MPAKSKISEQDVAYVADLANLELTPEERTRMEKDLNSILGYIDLLNELDTSNVPPMAQVLSGGSDSAKFEHAFRTDELRPCLAHEAALQNAPDTDGDFFKVPRVIEK